MIDVTGNWVGVITYGKEYRTHKGKELYFDMELIQQNENIRGISLDIGGAGISPRKASIEGSLKENAIEFIKQYATFHYYKNGETIIDNLRKGHAIKYSGLYNSDSQTFTGNWIIKGKVKLFGFIPINYQNTGIWSMKRKIEIP